MAKDSQRGVEDINQEASVANKIDLVGGPEGQQAPTARPNDQHLLAGGSHGDDAPPGRSRASGRGRAHDGGLFSTRKRVRPTINSMLLLSASPARILRK